MFLTVLKEQSFGSDHFLVLFSMKSIKKRKKKCFKRSLAFLSAYGNAAGLVGMAPCGTGVEGAGAGTSSWG